MADQNFWFPSQTGSIYTPAGDLRIKIYYDDGTAASNTDVGADDVKLSNLEMPFEVDSGDQSFRFSSINITFNNPIYDSSNNVFEQYSVFNSTYNKATFVKLYLDGSEIWHGIIDFSQIKKSMWYVDGSDLKYRNLNVKCYDVLAYFWFNSTTLSDIGYSDHDSLQTTIQNIMAEVGISSGDVILDSNYSINEACGNSYDFSDLTLVDFGSNMLCRTFLKNFLLGFGLFAYSWNADYWFVMRNGGSVKTIQNQYIVDPIEQIENGNPIEYVRIREVKDWDDLFDMSSGTDPSTYTHTKTYGNADDDNREFDILLEDFLGRMYTQVASPQYFGGCSTTDVENGAVAEANDEDENFYTEEIETGMAFEYNCSGSTPQDRSPIFSVAYDAGTGSTITFLQGVDCGDGSFYRIMRQAIDNGSTWGQHRLYKICLLVNKAAAIYNDFFLTSPNILKIKLRDISEFINLHNKFSILSLNHRARNISISFTTDEMSLELAQVA